MKLYESGENYLETILILKEKLGNIRSIDIVNEMNFTKPSVSVAMKKLRQSGYIEMDDAGYIYLTQQGREIAESVYDRHRTLKTFLVAIGVSDETASDDACRIEHIISEETFVKLKEHLSKLT